MRHFVRQILAFALIQGLILTLLCMHLRAHALTTYLGAIQDKHRLLDETASPRILVAGGSNAAFGISAETLARKMNRPAVNLGLHAALGRDFILGELEHALRPGDVAILSLEYDLYGSPFISQFLWELLLIHPSSVLDLQRLDLRALLDRGLGFAGHVASTALAHALHGRPALGFYERSVFNAHGDVTGHARLAPVRPFVGGSIGAPSDAQIDATLDRLQALLRVAVQRRATVHVVFPALARSQFERSAERIGAIVRRTRARLGQHVLGTLEEIPVDDGDFFDTAYHLTPAPAVARASRLSDEILQAVVAR